MAVTEDRRRITVRLAVLQVGAVVVFATLAISFWLLQIVQHAKFEEMAENNHQRTLALRAPRGILYDRNGQVLVENRHSFTISIVREHTKDIDRTVRLLSAVAGLDPNDVKAIVARHRSEPTYRPIVVVEDASLAQVAAITARRRISSGMWARSTTRWWRPTTRSGVAISSASRALRRSTTGC